MELSHSRVDIEASRVRHMQVYPDREFQPAATIPREVTEQWLVPFTPISFTEKVDWRIYKRDKKVHIPLVPYLLPAAPDLALGFMLQLAAGCFASLDRPVQKLHVATGNPVNDLIDEEHGRMWQYYVGFAVVLK